MGVLKDLYDIAKDLGAEKSEAVTDTAAETREMRLMRAPVSN